MQAAVLLIAFNRPEPLRQVFEAVRRAQPPRLYLAVDGARANRPEDALNVQAVRAFADQVDWPCAVRTRFSDSNLGVGYGPPAAIDWFFENEDSGIILEDDCVPAPSFFRYCEELLEQYRDDGEVAQICGSSYAPTSAGEASYFFTKYPDIWGWATWRRSWQTRDMDMRGWPAWRKARRLARMCGSTPGFVHRWTHIFDSVYAAECRDAWDYPWFFNCWSRDTVSIAPRVPLIRNVGFGADASHHTESSPPDYVRPLGALEFPLVAPRTKALDPAREQEIARYRFAVTRASDIAALARKLPVIGPAAIDNAKRLLVRQGR